MRNPLSSLTSFVVQAELATAVDERNSEAEAKEAALQRVSEMEASNEQLTELQSVVADLTTQLQLASASRQTQAEEVLDLRRQIAELWAENSVRTSSGAAAVEAEARLRVGCDAALPPPCVI